MIAAHRLSKRFGRFTAVDSIDFKIRKGQVVGFLGPNGAGKTTTIRLIAGYLPPTAGTVSVDGLDVSRHGLEVRRRIGYMPESTPLYGEMRVVEYLAFRARLFGLPRSQRTAAVGRAVERCWLGEVRRRPIHQLSKGYRQRVGLAAALLHDPAVLLLDEPTIGLDPTQIRQVRHLIRELAGDHTILLSSHILPEVEQTCDRILMIARGRIRAEGSIQELRATGSREGRYLVETDLPSAAALLRAMDTVGQVEVSPVDRRWQRISVQAARTAPDLREAIAQAVTDAGGAIRELHRTSASLEHLFVRMVAEAESGAAATVDGREG